VAHKHPCPTLPGARHGLPLSHAKEAAGTLLAFLNTPHSWHGHASVSGPRRVIQLNWVTDRLTVGREVLRHRVSAWMKRLFRLRERMKEEG